MSGRIAPTLLHEERRSILERRDAVLVLTLQPQRLTARREHLQMLGGLEQPRDEWSGGKHVLEVVEDEEQPLPAKAACQGILLVGPERRQADRVGDGGRHEFGVGKTVEGDVRRAVGEARSQLARRLHGEPRLSDAARAGERDEPNIASFDQAQQVLQLVIAPDERGRARRERRSLLRPLDARVEALGEQKREVVAHELPELLDRGERPVRRAGLLLDATDERAQALLAVDRRLLDVEQHRLTLRELVLVLQARDLPSRSDPAVALPVDAHEDFALADVGRVKIARRMRACALLEQDRREMQRRDRLARRHALEGKLAERRGDEDAQPAIRSEDRPPSHGVSLAPPRGGHAVSTCA